MNRKVKTTALTKLHLNVQNHPHLVQTDVTPLKSDLPQFTAAEDLASIFYKYFLIDFFLEKQCFHSFMFLVSVGFIFHSVISKQKLPPLLNIELCSYKHTHSRGQTTSQ